MSRELKAPKESLAWCPALVTDSLSGVASLLAALVVAYAAAMAAARSSNAPPLTSSVSLMYCYK